MKRIVFSPSQFLELFDILDSTKNEPFRRRKILSSKITHLNFNNNNVYRQFVYRIKTKQKLYIESGFNMDVLLLSNGRPYSDEYVALLEKQKIVEQDYNNQYKYIFKKKPTSKVDIENIDKGFLEDILNWVVDEYWDGNLTDEQKDKLHKIIQKNKKDLGSYRKIRNIFPICSHETIRKICNVTKQNKRKTYDRKEVPLWQVENVIRYLFVEKYKKMVGRELIANDLSTFPFYDQNNKIIHVNYSGRQVGNIMNRLGYSFMKPKNSKKEKEVKNTSNTTEDLVCRDYHNTLHSELIYATDITYIPAPIDVSKNQNHVFLSVIICHKTKFVESFKLSIKNDVRLVVDQFKELVLPPNSIVHSDHGVQYSSLEFLEYLLDNSLKSSMGRIGNSLDNREIEYFFKKLKHWLLDKIDLKSLTFEELNNLISNFVDFYNNIKKQKCLNWLTPAQAKLNLNKF